MDSLIKQLNAAGVRYLVIGGQAVRLHGLPRFSMDWDLLVPARDTENFRRIGVALGSELDVQVEPLGPNGENLIQTYQTRYGVVQFHLSVPGLVSFDAAALRSVILKTEDGDDARCLSAADLLACKKATNRPQDQQDILFLEELMRSARP